MMGDFVKASNSLNPLIFFTENCKTYKNLAKPVSISKLTPIRFSSLVKFINDTFDNFNNILVIVFNCLERPLKVILKNKWIKNNLLQISSTRIF